MLTDQQYARLPEILQEIVDNDQERTALKAPSLIAFEVGRAIRALDDRRKNLRVGAALLWGQNLNKNAAHANKRVGDDSELSDSPGSPLR